MGRYFVVRPAPDLQIVQFDSVALCRARQICPYLVIQIRCVGGVCLGCWCIHSLVHLDQYSCECVMVCVYRGESHSQEF